MKQNQTNNANNIKINWNGCVNEMLLYAEKKQLMDVQLWKKFVNEFTYKNDSLDRGWRCEFWGKMMRGGALVYQWTQNPELYKVLENTVEDMLQQQDDLGRFSTYTLEKEFSGWDMWGRKYIILSLCYFYDICKSEVLRIKIIQSLCKHVDYIMSKVGSEEGKIPILETSKWYGGLNSASILEAIVRLYKLTEDQKYLDFAKYIIDEGCCRYGNIFEIALDDTYLPYQYPTTKAYEMMSCFEGLIEYYEVTGDLRCKEIATSFAYKLAKSDITIIGASGLSMECFDHSAVRQASSNVEKIMQETCVTVTWMKLCFRMLRLTNDVYFADCFEKSLYNAYFGSLNNENIVNDAVFPPYTFKDDVKLIPSRMHYDSYAPLRRGVRGKAIGGAKILNDGTYYGCCTCIAAVGAGITPFVAVDETNRGITLSLYEDGTIQTHTPNNQNIQIYIETKYPLDGQIKIKLHIEQQEEFDITIRIPNWSKNSTIYVNDVKQNADCGYTTLHKIWNDNDQILLELDMRMIVIPAPICTKDVLHARVNWDTGENIETINIPSEDSPNHIALQKGPIIFARDARLSGNFENVNILKDSEGFAVCQPIKTDFSTLCAYKVQEENGKYFDVIDYASAGKTWDKRSEYEVWIPIHN